jgi:hypothetical protein
MQFKFISREDKSGSYEALATTSIALSTKRQNDNKEKKGERVQELPDKEVVECCMTDCSEVH